MAIQPVPSFLFLLLLWTGFAHGQTAPNATIALRGRQGTTSLETPTSSSSSSSFNAMLRGTERELSTEGHEFCWKSSYGRGLGKALRFCPRDKDRVGQLCYVKCGKNMARWGLDCHTKCPHDWTDTGFHCRQDQDTYGRGIGHIRAEWCGHDCELCLGLWYTRCKEGFKPVGCNLCEPKINCGELNMGRQLGTSCTKKVEAGNPSPLQCHDTLEEQHGLLCYERCKPGFTGNGPICWAGPPPGWVDCGAGAAMNDVMCGLKVADQVGNIGYAAGNAVLASLSFGASLSITMPGSAPPRTASFISKLPKSLAPIASKAAARLSKYLNYDTASLVTQLTMFVRNMILMLDQAKARGELTASWYMRLILSVKAIVEQILLLSSPDAGSGGGQESPTAAPIQATSNNCETDRSQAIMIKFTGKYLGYKDEPEYERGEITLREFPSKTALWIPVDNGDGTHSYHTLDCRYMRLFHHQLDVGDGEFSSHKFKKVTRNGVTYLMTNRPGFEGRGKGLSTCRQGGCIATDSYHDWQPVEFVPLNLQPKVVAIKSKAAGTYLVPDSRGGASAVQLVDAANYGGDVQLWVMEVVDWRAVDATGAIEDTKTIEHFGYDPSGQKTTYDLISFKDKYNDTYLSHPSMLDNTADSFLTRQDKYHDGNASFWVRESSPNTKTIFLYSYNEAALQPNYCGNLRATPSGHYGVLDRPSAVLHPDQNLVDTVITATPDSTEEWEFVTGSTEFHMIPFRSSFGTYLDASNHSEYEYTPISNITVFLGDDEQLWRVMKLLGGKITIQTYDGKYLAVHRNGTVHLSEDQGLEGIFEKVNIDGTDGSAFYLKIRQFPEPKYLAADDEGTVYVSNTQDELTRWYTHPDPVNIVVAAPNFESVITSADGGRSVVLTDSTDDAVIKFTLSRFLDGKCILENQEGNTAAGSSSGAQHSSSTEVWQIVGATLGSIPDPNRPVSPLKSRRSDAGHYYQLFPSADYAFAARTVSRLPTHCGGMRAHLVTIGSQAENDFVQTFRQNQQVWIGLNDASSEGTFQWVAGEPLTYTNWAPGEPDNSANADYVSMAGGGTWNILPGTNNYMFIAEYDCEPPPTAAPTGAPTSAPTEAPTAASSTARGSPGTHRSINYDNLALKGAGSSSYIEYEVDLTLSEAPAIRCLDGHSTFKAVYRANVDAGSSACGSQGKLLWNDVTTFSCTWSRSQSGVDQNWINTFIGGGCGVSPTYVDLPERIPLVLDGNRVSFTLDHTISALCSDGTNPVTTVWTGVYNPTSGKILWQTMTTQDKPAGQCSWMTRDGKTNSWLAEWLGFEGVAPTNAPIPSRIVMRYA
ncbi:lectin domain family 4 member M [Seminavis robusta]|uniref:Lectin domain family 4 member M n=1 Tax=Seminavis robusta TaxID=568900 RepID=A0A9N8E4K6_9STRA|nr:lectin domain family 4 member M [Seminavis robusta]|eukprot:Sro613_g175540.1 lectin domain family 4 member M (1322) ;mRNA; f:1565-5833